MRADKSDEEYEATRLKYYPMDPPARTPQRNHWNNYVVEEYIHHGNYRHRRVVEVYDLTRATIYGILESSAYNYHAVADEHKLRLLEDLKRGRVSRAIGWSTFRVLNPEEE